MSAKKWKQARREAWGRAHVLDSFKRSAPLWRRVLAVVWKSQLERWAQAESDRHEQSVSRAVKRGSHFLANRGRINN